MSKITISVHEYSLEIGEKQYIEGLPPSMADKLKDLLIAHGGRNYNGTFMRHGSLSAKLVAGLVTTILKYFADQRKRENDYKREKTASEHRIACREYLKQVEPADLTVEDALLALGYGRDGLEFL